jgi:hypothetical protein
MSLLAITEKEMEVFGLNLPERCVLIGHNQERNDLITVCTQDKVTGQIAQRVIDTDMFGIAKSDFISEVNKKNEFKNPINKTPAHEVFKD